MTEIRSEERIEDGGFREHRLPGVRLSDGQHSAVGAHCLHYRASSVRLRSFERVDRSILDEHMGSTFGHRDVRRFEKPQSIFGDSPIRDPNLGASPTSWSSPPNSVSVYSRT